tara:strand:+ start:2353 stop:2718 length:366 start_codon:yes stop_codon:yes gene_type:complete
MASSVTTQLTISSNNATSDTLSIVVNKTLSTKEPIIGIARVSVGTTAVEVFAKTVTDITYAYLKNTHGTHTITVSDSVAPTAFLTLSPDEFAFIPIKASAGLKLTSSGAGAVVEYALFTKS